MWAIQKHRKGYRVTWWTPSIQDSQLTFSMLLSLSFIFLLLLLGPGRFLPVSGSCSSVCRCSASELWGCFMRCFQNSSVCVLFALWSLCVIATMTYLVTICPFLCWGMCRVVATFYAWKSFTDHCIVCLCKQNMYINWNKNFSPGLSGNYKYSIDENNTNTTVFINNIHKC